MNKIISFIPWSDIFAFIPELIQIAILYLVIYAIIKGARGSRFGQVLMGIGILFAILIAFTFLFSFDVLTYIVKTLLFYLVMSSVVIFQPEIRRILATIGSFLFSDRARMTIMSNNTTPEKICDIIFKLARRQTGALIAFERGISLKGYDATGVELDALISSELFFSIFTEPMPLHDGGVIIRSGRIAAAHCLFPVSNKEELSESGMRHRAAVGLSEETDSLVIVISEERGQVSVAHNGKLVRFPDCSESSHHSLLRWIRKAMPEQQKTAGEIVGDWLKKSTEKLTTIITPPKKAKEENNQ